MVRRPLTTHLLDRPLTHNQPIPVVPSTIPPPSVFRRPSDLLQFEHCTRRADVTALMMTDILKYSEVSPFPPVHRCHDAAVGSGPVRVRHGTVRFGPVRYILTGSVRAPISGFVVALSRLRRARHTIEIKKPQLERLLFTVPELVQTQSFNVDPKCTFTA